METLNALKFLVTGPFVLVVVAIINWMTSPGDWWVQWVALGIGIAWLICLFKVIRTAILLGGLSALVALVMRQRRRSNPPYSA